MKRNWINWLKAAAIRAVRTFAQTIIGMVTVGQAFIEVNWGYVLSVSGVAALLSVLMSLAGLPEVNEEFPEQDTFNGDSEVTE